jgi:hypothetical protein
VGGKLEVGIEVATRFQEHGTAIERLQGKQLVVDGLAAAVAHGVAVEPAVGPKVQFVVQQELEGMSEKLAGYGVVAGMDTKASVSGAVGTGIVRAVVNKEATFVVTAVGHDGKQRNDGGDAMSVVFESTPVECGGAAAVDEPPSKRRKKTQVASNTKQKQKKAVPAPAAPVVGVVVDLGDGTYHCSYTPPLAAVGVGEGATQWQLAVHIGGVHIAGSPFVVEVAAVNRKEFVFERITQGDQGMVATFDGQGVLHWIGTNGGTAPYVNPHTMEGGGGVVAAMSSVSYGGSSTPAHFVIHDHDGSTPNSTNNIPNSWMSVDLGAGRLLAATHYALRHGRDNGYCRLLQWQFEGSNDGASWTLLKAHTHSTSPFPDHGFSVAAWPVDPPPAPPSAAAVAAGGGDAAGAGAAGSHGFRHFRIIQTGKNSLGYDSLSCAGIELYGVLCEHK